MVAKDLAKSFHASILRCVCVSSVKTGSVEL